MKGFGEENRTTTAQLKTCSHPDDPSLLFIVYLLRSYKMLLRLETEFVFKSCRHRSQIN